MISLFILKVANILPLLIHDAEAKTVGGQTAHKLEGFAAVSQSIRRAVSAAMGPAPWMIGRFVGVDSDCVLSQD